MWRVLEAGRLGDGAVSRKDDDRWQRLLDPVWTEQVGGNPQ